MSSAPKKVSRYSLPPDVHLVDATSAFQRVVSSACAQARQETGLASGSVVSVTLKLEKGDYAIRAIQIPKDSSVTLSSKERVRLLYIGNRNRPMFVLDENSSLAIKEKLEIFYNTNNVQEVMRLMIRRLNGNVDIAAGVKVSLFSQKTSRR